MDTKKRLDGESQRINIGFVKYSFRKYWWVYLIIFSLFMGLAAFYCKVKTPVYDLTGIIILNDDENDSKATLGGLGSLMASFSLGGSSYKYVEDELARIGSNTNITRLVKDLGLNYTYTSKEGFFKSRQPYFDNNPIQVYVPQSVLDTISSTTIFDIRLSADGGRADIRVKQKKGKVVYDEKNVRIPANIKTPLATFHVSTTSYFKKLKAGETLNFRAFVQSTPIAVRSVGKKLRFGSPNKKSDLVYIEYKDTDIPRGKAVIDHCVEIYNETGAADLKEQALSSVNFVKSRLEKLYTELESSESSIEAYKRANGIVDPEAEAEYIFKKKQVAEAGAIEYETKAAVTQMIIDFLRTDGNKYSLIPFAEDMPKEPVEEYNKLVMERIRLQENAKGNNAALKSITSQVDAMRANLLSSLERQLSATRIAIKDMNRSGAGTDSRIASYPTMEKDLLGLYRDQKIKNQIYAYLLQKLEENELKLSRDIRIGKVVDAAYPDIEPSSPNKELVFIGMAILSVICTYCGLWCLRFIGKIIGQVRSQGKHEDNVAGTTV